MFTNRTRVHAACWTLALLGMFSSGTLHAQVAELEDLEARWKGGEYQEVVTRGLVLRDKPFGRNVEVDYMIGTSLCRLPNREKTGRNHLRWCLESYQGLTPPVRATIRAEIDACQTATRAHPGPVIGCKFPPVDVGVRVNTKMFSSPGDVAISQVPPEQVERIPSATLLARRLPAGEPLPAEQRLRDTIASLHLSFSLDTTSVDTGFAVADFGAGVDGAKLLKQLHTYADFFKREFGLELPPDRIAVYVVKDFAQLRELSRALHGLGLPPLCLGYSHRDDLSILAICGTDAVGTVFHELCHLAMRSSFGDAPPWLDEGLAALYEVSRIEGDSVLGVDNWRRDVLEAPGARPIPLDRLLGTTWPAFDTMDNGTASNEGSMKTAVVHATARYFLYFLQEQKALAQTVKAYRLRSPDDLGENPSAEGIRLMEKITGRPIEKVNTEFLDWFHKGR